MFCVENCERQAKEVREVKKCQVKQDVGCIGGEAVRRLVVVVVLCVYRAGQVRGRSRSSSSRILFGSVKYLLFAL